MKWIVIISALPDGREQLTTEAASSVDALREVLGREMVAAALERRPGASLCISVMQPVKKSETTKSLLTSSPTGGLELE